MSELTDARLAVGVTRAQREAAWRARTDADLRMSRFLNRDGIVEPFDRQLNPELAADLDTATANLEAAKAAENDAHAAYDQAMSGYAGLAAAAPLFEAGCADPVLLLPVRVEAVYRTSTETGAPELRIRVYPDDVHVDSHEPELTDGEVAAGKAYWREVRAAGDGSAGAERRQAAWHVLTGAVRGERAIWVREALTPADDGAGAPSLTFPEVARRPAAWNRAAHTLLLPDRFDFSAYRDGALVWRHPGANLPDTLPLGIAPQSADHRDQPADGLPLGIAPQSADHPDQPADGLPFDAASRWLVDFDAAVALGMGLVVPLDSPDERFDLLTVVGVGSQDSATGAERVETALAAHVHAGGLVPVPLGTPTNNTPGSRSGWRSRGVPTDPDTVAARRADYDPGSRQDAARLATALGVDGAPVLAGVCDPADDDAAVLRVMHKLKADEASYSWIWQPAGLEGPFRSRPTTPPPWWPVASKHFTEYVRSRGPLPSLRIGRQPYGILPVSSTELWQADGEEAAVAAYVGSFHLAFAQHVDRALQVGEGADQDATLLDLLSREGNPRHLNEWFATYYLDGITTVPPLQVGGMPYDTLWARTTSQLSPLTEQQLQDGAQPAEPTVIDEFPATIPDALREFLARRPLAGLLSMFDAAVTSMRQSGNPIDPVRVRQDYDRFSGDMWQVLQAPTRSFFYSSAAGVASELFETLTGLEPLPEQVSAAITTAEVLMKALSGYVALEDDAIRDLPRVERLMRETMHPLSHRVDAWATSLVTRRLDQLRDASPTGVRTGAYGWLTDVEATDPNPSREGYVITPSLQHATTAAVLRSGWQAHSDQKAFAVDIQSARVRRAQAMVEGVRAGQTVGALLGYQFERALHDAELDRFVSGFRKRYPLAPLVTPDAADADTARVTIGAQNVVDGQALRVDSARLFEGKAALSQAADANLDGDAPTLLRIIAELEETFDAVGDLLLAESVHQLVGGSALRAGLAADAAGRAQDLPSDYEVLRTPRSGLAVTHHVAILLSGELPTRTGWANARPLVDLEPGLEGWARTRLGPTSDWSFGDALESLQLSALDLLALSPDALRAAAGDGADAEELERLDVVCGQLRAVLSAARPLTPAHLGWPVGAAAAGHDLADLHDRVGGWLTAVRTAAEELKSAAEQDVAGSLAALTALGVVVGAGTPDSARAQLLAKITAVAELEDLDGLGAPPSVDDDPAGADAWLGAVLGRTAALLPPWLVVAPRLTTELPAAPEPEPAADDVADWWQDLTLVRPQLAAFDTALLAGEVVGRGAPAELAVVQQPRPDGSSGPWLATAPAPDQPLTRSALVLERSAGGGKVRGLLVDAWTEVVPRSPAENGPKEVVGVAFDFDRPGARAPQALLIAVPPDPARGWCVEDLHGCVEDTLRLARVRSLILADLPELCQQLPIPLEVRS